MRHTWFRLAISASIVVCLTNNALGKSDFYIRSQYPDGTFKGFHEILLAPKKGFHRARYCERFFWVSLSTVVWTEEQVAEGRTLLLEENIGSDRKVVCRNNSSFATLDDLGLEKREVDKIRSQDAPVDKKSHRIRTIRDAFKEFR